ncbi:proteasome component region PCI domain-containing protein [Reticulomyxa filosa]|uniref:COP9 signalosome complex subunit 3 n=1 Tax=Reticulomyxa filosa TaxID=46433 RepID=X6M617_RETFI|nr:proteasome component region PCI domain-containing protein [Reticulomyxa filosa]|eukprot:ETO08475.1 proteasome component region PCI domain-containing protein [Reticulomyxa filosa]
MLQTVFSKAQNQTLEQFVQDAQQATSKDWPQFVSNWKYGVVCRLLARHKPQIEMVLNSLLRPEKHSVAYSYVLGFKAGEKMEDVQYVQTFVSQVKRLLECADGAQIALFPRPLTDAVRAYVDILKSEGMGLVRVIPTLKRAIQLFQNGDETILTYAHSELMYCCVQSMCYHLAFPEVEQEIIQVQSHGAVRSYDHLMYFYYSGLVFIAMKKYDKALEALSMALTAPSEHISAIQLESYKKYVLVSLVWRQQLPKLPRYTSNTLLRYYRKFCSEYVELVDAFAEGVDSVSKVIERHAEIFTKDKNFGLVQQVKKTLQKHAVRKLTSVYTRLSIEKVKDLCAFESVPHAKKILVSMIRSGELAATMDSQGVVTFEEQFTTSDAEMLSQLHKRIHSLLRLWNSLDKNQLEVKKTPNYIRKKLNLGGAGPMMGDDLANQALLEHMVRSGGFS